MVRVNNSKQRYKNGSYLIAILESDLATLEVAPRCSNLCWTVYAKGISQRYLQAVGQEVRK